MDSYKYLQLPDVTCMRVYNFAEKGQCYATQLYQP
jgi:hypothetical protein